MKKSSTLLSALAFFCTTAMAQVPKPAALPATLPPSKQAQEDAQYIIDHYDKVEKMIPMRDGKKLFTAIYTPKDKSQKYGIVMTRTPYTVSPYGATMRGTLGQNMLFAKEGYIFVYQDVRGRYMSEGDFVNVRPQLAKGGKYGKNDIDESTDTYDTIDWLVKNLPGNNGKVGILGISYPGFYSTASLPNAHPALKAVSPQAPVTEWFKGDDFHHNGVFFEMDAFAFLTGFGVPRPKPILPADIKNQIKTNVLDNYDFYLKQGALPNLKKNFLGDSVKFWDDMMNHPNYDEFWQKMNILPHLTNIKPAVMTVGGFFDAEDAYGAQEVYKAIEKQNDPKKTKNMLVLGPWFHGGWERGDGDFFGDIQFGQKTSEYFRENIEMPFFNYYLKGKGEMTLPEASIFITGSNEWKKFDKWPAPNTSEKTLYLQANGKLSFSAPTVSNNFDQYMIDPNAPTPYQDGIQARRTREYMIDDQRFASRRPDVKTFQTDVLTEDMTLAGPLLADLFASTTGTDADFVVKLIDVYPDDAPNPTPNPKGLIMPGYQMLVRGEIFRGKFRNSFEKPEAFVPGKVTEVKYALPDVAHTFKKGHKIMIQVQHYWFPLGDRNPNQFLDINKAKDSDFIQATMRLYHDKEAPSSLKVTVLK